MRSCGSVETRSLWCRTNSYRTTANSHDRWRDRGDTVSGGATPTLPTMAMSLGRPDPSSPTDVSAATFSASRKGFDPDEVRAFLREVAQELARLQDREAELERELGDLRQAPPVSLAELDEAVAAGLLSEEATRIVATARETAAQIKARAEESSAVLLQEANEEAQRVRAEAEIEAGRRRQDAASKT